MSITVLLPAFNAEATIEAAVRSLLDGTAAAVRILVLDDGSDDRTPDVVEALRLPQVTLVRSRHRGIVPTLNDGLDRVDTEWVGRMDADDIAAPGRLDAQLAFLRLRPDIDAVGTDFYFSAPGARSPLHVRQPTEPALVRWAVMFRCPVLQPSILARMTRIIAAGRFDAGYAPAEDYEYLCRNADVLRVANLPRPLMHKREFSTSVSQQYAAQQRDASVRALHRLLQARLGRAPGADVAATLLYPLTESDPKRLSSAIEYVVELLHIADTQWGVTAVEREAIRTDASRRIFGLARRAAACGDVGYLTARRWLSWNGRHTTRDLLGMLDRRLRARLGESHP